MPLAAVYGLLAVMMEQAIAMGLPILPRMLLMPDGNRQRVERGSKFFSIGVRMG